MKINFKLKFLAFAAALALVSCEDDTLPYADGDPLNENVVALTATLSTPFDVAAPGTGVPFSVNMPQSFQSDAVITVKATNNNGFSSTGTATMLAGTSTATGSLVIASGEVFPSGTFDGTSNGVVLQVVGVLLGTLEPGTAYTVTSNEVVLSLLDRGEEEAPGLRLLLDWGGPWGANDFDMYVIDDPATLLFESAESGSRYEVDTFGSTEHPDGNYVVCWAVFSTDGIDKGVRLAITEPGGLVSYYNSSESGATPFLGPFNGIARITKTTDAASGLTTFTQAPF